MFDLFRSRDKAVRILLGAILVVVSLSMLTYLIPSYGGGGTTDQVVAKVGKEVITVTDVQRVLQQATRGRQIPPELLPSYIPQIVDDMVMQRALAYQAEQLGFRVSEAEMRDQIRQLIPALFQDGKFVGTEMYQQFLQQQNTSISEFETDLKRRMLMARLEAVALEGVAVSKPEVEREYAKRNEKIKLTYVKLTPAKFAAQIQPTTDEEQSYYKANLAKYQLPEKRNLTVLLADPNRIAQSLNPTDAELEHAYNLNKDAYRVPERVKVRHILLKTAGKPPEEDAKMKAKAEDLLKQIRAGGNFADLAKKNSEDPGSANNPKGAGELPDWITRGQTVKEFEQAAFTLKPGETSNVIKTEYGYHILQVLAHEQAHLRPFAEAKADIAEQWKKQRVADVMQNAVDKAQAAFRKDPNNAQKIAAEFNMTVLPVNGFTPGMPLPDVGMNPDFDQAVASLRKGEVSSPIGLSDDKVAIVMVTEIDPARPAKFEEVEAQVRQALIQERANAAMEKQAQQLLLAARKSGDLGNAAKAMGLEVATSEEFARNGTPANLGTASTFQDAFVKPVNSVVGPYTVSDGTVIGQVAQKIPADMSKLPEQQASIESDLRERKARERGLMFGEGIRETLTKSGKIKVNANVLKRLIAGGTPS
jgi:peptidyl-prolyl cis-trans isomerase D